MNVKLINCSTNDPSLIASMGAKICTSSKVPDVKLYGKALNVALDSGHDSVLEHVTFTFLVDGISRVATHQLVRHRIASYSQQSQRYVSTDYLQIKNNIVVPEQLFKYLISNVKINNEFYDMLGKLQDFIKTLQDDGISDEVIRYILPQGIKSNIMLTMNARELLHFFNLRCCNRADWEIRQLATNMLQICKEVAPRIFRDAGAHCVSGKCPEVNPCGKLKN